MHQTISKAQAQRFMLKRQGLLGATPFTGKKGLIAYVRQSGCVQYDPVDVCGKSHELAFLTRVKGFTREMLAQLLYEDRALIDFWDKNMSILLAEDWPYLEPVRAYYRAHGRGIEEINAVAPEIRAYLKAHGPTTSQELPIKGRIDWYWSPTNLSRAALEALFFRGELIIHHKRHTVKSYALAQDHLPAELINAPYPFSTEDERFAWQVLRRIGAVGLLWNKPSDAWLGLDGFRSAERERIFAALEAQGKIVPVQVEGLTPLLYLRPEELPLLAACEKPSASRKAVHFIPPLDCLMWDRKLIHALFDFSYTWEIYTPEVKRKYSYYVLPVLYGQQFAGRVEPVCQRKEGVLVMKRFWPEPGFRPTPSFKQAMALAAKTLADFHGLAEIAWSEDFWEGP